MTHLVLGIFDDPVNGLWAFLSIGAVALFVVFIPTVTWIDKQHKEREAFYKAETHPAHDRGLRRGRQGGHGIDARRGPPGTASRSAKA